MGINESFTVISKGFVDLNVFELNWLIPLLIVAVSLVLITREPQKWKILALPVMLGWNVVGLTQSYIIYLVSGVLFIIEIFSLQSVGELLNISYTTLKESYEKTDIGTERRRQQKLDEDIAKGQRRKRVKKELEPTQQEKLNKLIQQRELKMEFDKIYKKEDKE